MPMSGLELIQALRRLATKRNWPIEERSGKGAHLVVKLNGRRTVISQHRGDLATGTQSAILKQLGLTEQDLEG